MCGGMEASRLDALLARGEDLLSRMGAAPHAAAEDAVRELVAAYARPERGYHDLRHLAEILDRVDELAGSATHPDLVRLAAWYHDAVHTAATRPGQDEEASARMAQDRLAALGVSPATRREVSRLVRLTATHDPAPDDPDGAVLCDADLAVLARDRAGYADYVAGVRQEYRNVPDTEFRVGRAAVLRALVARPNLFSTDDGRARWEETARTNVTAELAELTELTEQAEP